MIEAGTGAGEQSRDGYDSHFLSVDAKTILTAYFGDTQVAVAEVVRERAIGLIHGNSGLGKTFACEYAAKRLALEVIWVRFQDRSTPREVASKLLSTVTGVPEVGTRAELSERLIDHLSEKARLIIVDEAQSLSPSAFNLLQYLWDDKKRQFALLLVGGNGCWRTVSRHPMFSTRLHQRVEFHALTDEDVLEIMPGYHSLYAAAEPELLLQINDQCCQGNFRHWASFTKAAQTKCQLAGLATVTEEIVAAVLETLGSSIAA